MRMSCGACGHWLFSLYEHKGKVLVKCQDCESVTEISVQVPRLTIAWPINIPSQGILCVMPGETENFEPRKIKDDPNFGAINEVKT